MLYDRDIREPLFEYLEETYGKIRILEEKNMGSSRADVVMIMEDGIAGIEIKSDADSYARLAGQIADYNLYFDSNMIVVGTTHALHIREKVPDWWGIITVDEIDGKPDFYLYRPMERNPESVLQRQLSFLWREELAAIQEQNGMYRYKEKSKQFVRDKIYDTVEPELLGRQIREALFERDYTGIAERITEYRAALGKKKRRRRKRGVRRNGRTVQGNRSKD